MHREKKEKKLGLATFKPLNRKCLQFLSQIICHQVEVKGEVLLFPLLYLSESWPLLNVTNS